MAESAVVVGPVVRRAEYGGGAHLGLVFREPANPLVNENRVKKNSRLGRMFATSRNSSSPLSNANRRELHAVYESLGLTKRQCHRLARTIIDKEIDLMKQGFHNARRRETLLFWVWLWEVTAEPPQSLKPADKLKQFQQRAAVISPGKATGRSPLKVEFTRTPRGVRGRAQLKLGKASPTYLAANNVRKLLINNRLFTSSMNANAPSNTGREALQTVFDDLGTTTTRLHRLARAVLDSRLKDARKWWPGGPIRSAETVQTAQITKPNKSHYKELLFWAWLWNATKRAGATLQAPRAIIIDEMKKLGVSNADASGWVRRLGGDARQAPGPVRTLANVMAKPTGRANSAWNN